MLTLCTSSSNAQPLSLDPAGNVTVSGPLYIPTECQGSHHALKWAAHIPSSSICGHLYMDASGLAQGTELP